MGTQGVNVNREIRHLRAAIAKLREMNECQKSENSLEKALNSASDDSLKNVPIDEQRAHIKMAYEVYEVGYMGCISNLEHIVDTVEWQLGRGKIIDVTKVKGL